MAALSSPEGRTSGGYGRLLFGKAGLQEMLAEQPALGGILEGMALGERPGAELGIEAQQVPGDLVRLLDLAARRKAGREEAQVAHEARIVRHRPAPPQDRVGIVAGGIARERDKRLIVGRRSLRSAWSLPRAKSRGAPV